MLETKLIIARHGNNFATGEQVRRIGITDLPLVQSGIEQAQKLATRLTDDGLLPDVVFTSNLRRTKQMADILLKQANISPPRFEREMFNEIDYGIDENQPEIKVVARLGDALKLWEEQQIPPIEWKIDVGQVIISWQNFANEIIRDYRGKKILVITSNGIARFAPNITQHVEEFKLGNQLKLATGAFGIIEHQQDWRILSWNIRP